MQAGLIGAVACALTISLALAGPAAGVVTAASDQVAGVPIGPVTREAIERQLPDWRQAAAAATPDPAASRALATVPPGARVDVYLGTWCDDSRREVARLFRALELLPGPPPFELRLISVDRSMRAPGYTEDAGLRFVPTIVVHRKGKVVGRIVESAVRGVERDLLDLLTGARRGTISGRNQPSQARR